MKLLIASPSQGHYGGIEAFVLALARAALEWPEVEPRVCFKLVKGHELAPDLKDAASELSCPVHFVKRSSWQLVELIRWAEIVHGQNASPDIVFPSWLMRKGLVLTIHNWRQPNTSLHPILWAIGASLADRRWYNSNFVWGTWEPKGKRQGSDRVPTVCRLPNAWRAPEERKGFLFVGRWIENKGIDDLVAAYARAKLDPKAWPLTILGRGPLQPKIMALTKELGVQGIEMPGFITDDEKARRIASARWLVAPAKTREDLGLTPIEARSVGVPAIVTRDGGLPESGGEGAIVVEPGNVSELAGALRQASSMSDEEYLRRAALGQATLKQFLRPMTFYLDEYRSVLGNPQTRVPRLA